MPCTPNNPRRSAGFTLIELVIVMVIVGVLAAIALPRMSQAAERQRLDAASKRVIADFALAQTRARAASESVTINFDLDTNSYQLDAVGGDAITVQLGEEPYGVKLSFAEFGTGTTATFNGFGLPTATGEIMLSTNQGTTTILLLSSGVAQR